MSQETMPPASLLDHPIPIPDRVDYEDTPPPEADADEPMGQRACPADEAGERAERTAQRGNTEARRRRADLASWVQRERRVPAFATGRWLALAGGGVTAALLVAIIAKVLMSPDPDAQQFAAGTAAMTDEPLVAALSSDPVENTAESTAESLPMVGEDAQGALATAAGGEPMALDEAAGGEIEMAPAAEAFPQVAALPGAADEAAGAFPEPTVDFMRIDPDGKAVVAGRAEPDMELFILDNGQPIGTAKADLYGLWTFISEAALESGRHEIALQIKSSDPVTGATVPVTPSRAEPAAPPAVAETATDAAATDQAATAESPADPPVQPELAAVPASETEVAEAPAEAVTDASQPTSETETAVVEPVTKTTAEPAPEPVAKPVAEAARASQTQLAAAVPSGIFAVQLASFTTPERATQAQSTLQSRYPDLLSGLELFVEQADLSDRGLVYRVRIGPFADRAAAGATCARFKAREHDCLVVKR